MDEAVARETEEAGVPEDSEDTGPQSGHGEAELSESEMEDEEEMDSSMDSEPEPDHLIFQLVERDDLAAVREILRSDRGAVHLQDGSDHTPLHYPAMGRDKSYDLHMAKLLLSHGALVNSRAKGFYTPLHLACMLGKENICNLLLTNGARFDLTLDCGSKTPLDFAINTDQLEIVKTLIR